ncbi:MAG: hypothetical protein PHG58_04510 [Clostridia bacterium]|nr:hypothetical protein [Clostridia bacterium]
MELIILVIVVSIIGNVIKSIREAQQKANQPNRKIPGQGDFSGKGFNFSGNQPPKVDTYSTSDRNTVSYSGQTSDRNSEYQSVRRQIVTNSITPVTSSVTAPVTSSVTSPAASYGEVTEPLHVIELDQTQKRHKLDLSPNAFIDGIILREVLGPPKSRRH